MVPEELLVKVTLRVTGLTKYEKSATRGTEPSVIFLQASDRHPVVLSRVNRQTWYVPGTLNLWSTSWLVEISPSAKFQYQAETAPMELSMKCSSRLSVSSI